MKLSRKFLLLSCLLFFLLSSTIFGISKDNKLDSSSTGSFIPSSTLPSLSYVTHDPIVITQDSEFDAAHGVSSGSGTELDPYIIEGWEITTATGNGIYVNGTSVYFIIRNCLIDGGGVSSELSYDSAILLNNTADGSALIENNTCLNSNFGILLSYSNFISSINNTITSCSVGIILQYANNSLLVNNTCTNNKWYGIFAGGSNNNSMIKNSCNLNVVSGLLLVYSDDNYLFENELYDNEYGIYIDRSNSSFIIDNLCVSNYYGIFYEDSFDNSLINSSCISNYYGIYFEDSNDNSLINNSCTSNTYGITLYYSSYNSIINNTCFENDFSGISFDTSHYNSIEGNTFTYSSYGVLIKYSDFNSFIGNDFSYNSQYGFDAFGCDDNLIANNTHSFNPYGFYLRGSYRNIIVFNLISASSSNYGLYLSSTCGNNLIHHNFFIDNGESPQAYDDGIDNQWYDDSTNEGNYWSDYGGTGDYSIVGTAGSVDPYPLSKSDYPIISEINNPSLHLLLMTLSAFGLGLIISRRR